VTRHEQLFEDYVTELRACMARAHAWWEELTTDEIASVGDRAAGLRRARQRWPCGPASHPRVLATYRKYFLACESLNEQLRLISPTDARVSHQEGPDDEGAWGVEADESVAPGEYPIDGWALLFDRLYARHPELAVFLGAMVFRPIGYDPVTKSYV